jgi:exodeoxyribonuclease VII small subunit
MQEEQAMSFEERLRQVQELTAKIESGALPLEDSMKEYERGMKILLDLDGELKDMTRRLTELRGTEQTEEPYAKV